MNHGRKALPKQTRFKNDTFSIEMYAIEIPNYLFSIDIGFIWNESNFHSFHSTTSSECNMRQ